MRRRKRRSDWKDDMAALVQLYRTEPEVKRFVDIVAKSPEAVWTWSNRDFPREVMEAAGDHADLLVAPDPITFRGSRHFQKTIYTYYPSEFLLEYVEELLDGVKWAESKGA